MGGNGPEGRLGPAGLTADRPTGLGRYVPIVHGLPHSQRTWLRADAIAGVTLWGILAHLEAR
jgi:hypothetical protein